MNGTDLYSVIIYELGHVVANKYHINGLEIAMKILDKSQFEMLYYLKSCLSFYAGSDLSGDEIISEVFFRYF